MHEYKAIPNFNCPTKFNGESALYVKVASRVTDELFWGSIFFVLIFART